MNTLSQGERVTVIGALVEGNSLRSVSRMTGIARNTITKLLVDLGESCMTHHHIHVRDVRVRRLQCDEIWAHAGAKRRNVSVEKEGIGWGDVWTWVARDADTKLVVSYLVGGRGADWAHDFIKDCADRVHGRVQLSMDGHKPYLQAVEEKFAADIDYATFPKMYGASEETVERSNLMVKMHRRRFKWLTNAFSKKLDNHAYAVAFHFTYFNFVRTHQQLKTTPAVAAELADHVWSMEELVNLLPEPEAQKRQPYQKRNSD